MKIEILVIRQTNYKLIFEIPFCLY